MGQSKKLREIVNLEKNIASFSDGQASLLDIPEDCLNTLTVRIKPNGGLYFGGTFDFEMELENYPEAKPSVKCLTKIYHPNIDCMEEEDNICLNILDSDWSDYMTLQDVVQGFLFLLYNPNLEDPLSPLFDSETSYDEFAENVAKSLKGAEIDNFQFDFNFDTELEDTVPTKGNNSDPEIINTEVPVTNVTDNAQERKDEQQTEICGDDVHAVCCDTKNTDSTSEAECCPKVALPCLPDRQNSKVDTKNATDENTMCKTFSENLRISDNFGDTCNSNMSKPTTIIPVFNDILMPEITMVTRMLPKFIDCFLCSAKTVKTMDDV